MLIDSILSILNPQVEKILQHRIEEYQRERSTPMTKTQIELERLSITYDMIKTVEAYTQKTDEVVSIDSTMSPKGSLEISATLSRDGVNYHFNTEVIYAGGHTVQCLHFRYIVKTNIPKTGNQTMATALKTEIKRLKGIDKINDEITQLEARIDECRKQLEVNSKLTRDEIWELVKHKVPQSTWQQIVERGADKNFEYSEEKFNQSKQESKESSIDFWIRFNIYWPNRDITEFTKSVESLKRKLDKLMNG